MSHITNKAPFQQCCYCFLSLVLLLLLSCVISPTSACPPEVCICKWKGGKQTVECGGQQLSTIPEGMDPGTQVLNFSGNALQVLQSERFLRMDLLNLQKIFLSRNQLIRIHEKAFRGLTNLVELDLADNSLQNVPSETFQDYTSLMRLSLSGNPIRELKTSAFRHLSFLTTLELSNCHIERIENEAFVGMDNLERLRLDGNRIGFIQGPHILPKSLHDISLQSNRWTCDCRLIDIHAWLVNYNTPQIEEPKCVEPPRLKGQFIKSLKKDELACLPEVTPKSTYTEISEGRNISIMCVVRAIPEPKVLWLFNGQVMTNDSLVDNLHMYYYIDESAGSGSEEKRSEIFIYNVGTEDNGTFSCVGQNVAGTTFSNYTLRVIIKEPPVVNEVSFPRDYMNYIIASSTGAGVIFVVLLCTVVIKCKQRKPSKRKKGSSQGNVGNGSSSDGSGSNDTGLMKCSSIINDGCGDSLNGVSGVGMLLGGETSMTPTKLAKENGVIIGGQMKQNLIMYAPAHFQQHLLDGAAQAMQLNVSAVGSGSGGTPPPMMVGVGGLSNGMTNYCSPPSSMRNFVTDSKKLYQEKNPDLVNDAESVKNKLKSSSTDDTEYDAASDCSGPCSIQGMPPLATTNYDQCYQLAAASSQFGSQLLRASNGAAAAASRFAAMTTLPRGMQLKTVMQHMQQSPLAMTANGSGGGGAATLTAAPGGQHQVDVHLNPVCFLGQDGSFAYDYSTAAPPHHHLHLQQQQHALLSPAAMAQQSTAGQLPQQQQQQQQQQQNFYRTLPHNRAHKQQQFAASAANPGLRYSLEAEFLQRSGTPTSYDKYLPNVRFTAEGYPLHSLSMSPVTAPLVQYPSPPEGYKNCSSPPQNATATSELVGTISQSGGGFQQWPPCLPGYHAQPIRYPPTMIGMAQQQQLQQQQQTSVVNTNATAMQSQSQIPPVTSCYTQTKNSAGQQQQQQQQQHLAATTATTTGTEVSLKKRCVAAQADDSTIPECDDEADSSPTTAAAKATTAAVMTATDGGVSSGGGGGGGKASEEESTKLRHLTGPLADSPDEGYVGDSQEGSDI